MLFDMRHLLTPSLIDSSPGIFGSLCSSLLTQLPVCTNFPSTLALISTNVWPVSSIRLYNQFQEDKKWFATTLICIAHPSFVSFSAGPHNYLVSHGFTIIARGLPHKRSQSPNETRTLNAASCHGGDSHGGTRIF